jgi:hypothetical protein
MTSKFCVHFMHFVIRSGENVWMSTVLHMLTFYINIFFDEKESVGI